MFRISAVRRDTSRQSAPRRRVWWAALGLPALVPVVLAVAEVTYFVVSPTDIPAGGSATGTVRVSGFESPTSRPRSVTVTLTNSNPSVVTVPASVAVDFGGESFQVAAVPGAAGCATISARAGATPPKSQVVYVLLPPPPATALKLVVPPGMMGQAGEVVTGTVQIELSLQQPPLSAERVPESRVVQLTSSNPMVQVPASVTVSLRRDVSRPVYRGQTSFDIRLSANVAQYGCSLITATSAGEQSRGLIKIFLVGG